MGAYIVRRLLLVIPTLWAIITLNFFIIQIAPGGPVDQMIAQMEGSAGGFSERFTGSTGEANNQQLAVKDENSLYRGSRGLDPEVIAAIEKQFGFDKPMHVRYFNMLWDYARFDFGDSLFRGSSVVDLIKDRLPVSISLGLWTTLIIYFVSVPLGIRKALKHNSKFDIWTSAAVIIGNAIPGFLFAILLVILFAGGSYVNWFPLRGLVSDDWETYSTLGKIADYLWHMVLPVSAMVIGGFASLTLLTKNSFLDEIHKQYVRTAIAKGQSQQKVLYGHVFRNAMLIIIAGFPAAFIGIFFTGSMLIEVIFSLDGLGLLGFEATLQRDYPVIFASLYIFTLLGLLLSILSDLTYTLVDPRIDFEQR